MIDISVLIPVRNGGDHFRTTLVCLGSQKTADAVMEIVIVDDGSDQPVAVEFANELPSEVHIQVIRLEGEGNRPRARNIALKASSGSVILMMDADLDFNDDLVIRHLNHHRSGVADVVMGARIDAWRENPTRFQKWSDSRAMGGKPAGFFPWNYCITGNFSIRRSLIEQVGGSDESIISYGGEDTELGYRFLMAGATFYWDPDIQVRHLDEIDLDRYAGRMVTYGQNNLRYLLAKHSGIESLLGNQWVKPIFASPRRPRYMVMRLVTRITVNPCVYRIFLAWMKRVGFPMFIFTYISVAGCILGLQGRDFMRNS